MRRTASARARGVGVLLDELATALKREVEHRVDPVAQQLLERAEHDRLLHVGVGDVEAHCERVRPASLRRGGGASWVSQVGRIALKS